MPEGGQVIKHTPPPPTHTLKFLDMSTIIANYMSIMPLVKNHHDFSKVVACALL